MIEKVNDSDDDEYGSNFDETPQYLQKQKSVDSQSSNKGI